MAQGRELFDTLKWLSRERPLMPGFVLTNQAKADLFSIGSVVYTADTWRREQRDRYLALLVKILLAA